MSVKGVWMLDIDGVVNASHPEEGGWSEVASGVAIPAVRGEVDGFGYPIRWAPGLLGEILQICKQHELKLMLCSTWCGQSRNLLEVLGINIEEAWSTPGHGGRAWLVKWSTVRAIAAEVERVIWTDDDLVYTSARMPENVFPLAPNERTGLSRADLMAIRAWLANPEALSGAESEGSE